MILKNIFERNKEQVIKWYLEDKLSGIVIQKRLGTKSKKIYLSLHKWGIKVRSKSEALKGKPQTEEAKQHRIIGLYKCGKKFWSKAVELNKIRFKTNTGKTYEEIYGPEKAKIIKDKKSGINSRWYINGHGKGEYPLEFNETLKKKILRRDKFTCQECKKHRINLKRNLDIHHIDFDKKNNNEKNLISLCRKCHLITQFFKPREDIINYYKLKMELR
jgi:hypothetical protein